MTLTHASFFSGVGGLDMGLERAGWTTVSFSEVDPYACAVLASRWPGVPNLGDILALAGHPAGSEGLAGDEGRRERPAGDIADAAKSAESGWHGTDWRRAHLWSGGFPCQDLSVAGKRAGLAGERSGLAFAFLDLVERHRPRWFLLENVPGLFNSHRGADLAALLCRMGELGYGVAWRVLDARHYGVPQRRRRVFLLATNAPGGRAGAERAAEVLALAAGSGGDPASGREAGPGVAVGVGVGARGACWEYVADERGALSVGGHVGIQPNGQDAYTGELVVAPLRSNPYGDHISAESHLVSPSPDPARVRAADGLAGRLDDRERVAFVKVTRPHGPDGDGERWAEQDISPTLNAFDVGDVRATTLMGTIRSHVYPGSATDHSVVGGFGVADDPLLPLGLDSHRYRVIGNGVVANVAEAIGLALRQVIERDEGAAA